MRYRWRLPADEAITEQDLEYVRELVRSINVPESIAKILVARGVRTFDATLRNTFDVAAIVLLKHISHLPVIADPSHACGYRELVPALARVGVAAGADGLIVEVHPTPEKAWSDGEQSLNFAEFDTMMASLKPYVALREEAMAAQTLETVG